MSLWSWFIILIKSELQGISLLVYLFILSHGLFLLCITVRHFVPCVQLLLHPNCLSLPLMNERRKMLDSTVILLFLEFVCLTEAQPNLPPSPSI